MKNFAAPSFRLRDSWFEIRLIYSLFFIFILTGLATIWYLQFQRIGINYERVVAYYLGGEIGGQVYFAKNLNALIEETHFHAFTMSVVFLILAHLFLATSIPKSAKLFFYPNHVFLSGLRYGRQLADAHVFAALCLSVDRVLAGFVGRLRDNDFPAALRDVAYG